MEKHSAFNDLNQLYNQLLYCLESIQSNSDPNNQFDAKSTTETAGLLKQLKTIKAVLRNNFLNSSGVNNLDWKSLRNGIFGDGAT